MEYISNFFNTFTLEFCMILIFTTILGSVLNFFTNLIYNMEYIKNIKSIKNKVLLRLIVNGIFRRFLLCTFFITLIFILKYDVLNYTITIFNNSFILSENYTQLLLEVSLAFLGISISILTLTHIFKEKFYNMEIVELFTNIASGFKVISNLKVLLIINIVAYIVSIFCYHLHFYYTIFGLFIFNILSSLYVINYLFSYLFNSKKTKEKARKYVIEYYSSLPYCYKIDYNDFTDQLFEYGNKIEQHEYIKTLDYIRIIFRIYEIVISKYIEFNSINIPDKGNINDDDRDIMVDNANKSMFLKAYYIANICQLLYNFMKKDNKRGFERIINMIYMNHITFFDMDYLEVYKMIDVEKNIWSEDMINFSLEGQIFNIKNITTYFQKSIIFEWKYALEKIFLSLNDYEIFYQNKMNNLLSYINLLLKELEEKYKKEKELEKSNKEKVNNYD